MSGVRVAACRSLTGVVSGAGEAGARAGARPGEGHSARAAERARTEEDEVRV